MTSDILCQIFTLHQLVKLYVDLSDFLSIWHIWYVIPEWHKLSKSTILYLFQNTWICEIWHNNISYTFRIKIECFVLFTIWKGGFGIFNFFYSKVRCHTLTVLSNDWFGRHSKQDIGKTCKQFNLDFFLQKIYLKRCMHWLWLI